MWSSPLNSSCRVNSSNTKPRPHSPPQTPPNASAAYASAACSAARLAGIIDVSDAVRLHSHAAQPVESRQASAGFTGGVAGGVEIKLDGTKPM